MYASKLVYKAGHNSGCTSLSIKNKMAAIAHFNGSPHLPHSSWPVVVVMLVAHVPGCILNADKSVPAIWP